MTTTGRTSTDHAPGRDFALAARLAGHSRIAFASLGTGGWSIRMYSLDLDRM